LGSSLSLRQFIQFIQKISTKKSRANLHRIPEAFRFLYLGGVGSAPPFLFVLFNCCFVLSGMDVPMSFFLQRSQDSSTKK
jgi:hypothetical protein